MLAERDRLIALAVEHLTHHLHGCHTDACHQLLERRRRLSAAELHSLAVLVRMEDVVTGVDVPVNDIRYFIACLLEAVAHLIIERPAAGRAKMLNVEMALSIAP